ncbi:NADH:flavin oxidoreductase, Old Yellow Enzyme family protein, partial [Giardia duodenalis]
VEYTNKLQTQASVAGDDASRRLNDQAVNCHF